MEKLLNNIKTVIEKTYCVDSGLKDVSDCLISEKTFNLMKDKGLQLKNHEHNSSVVLHEFEEGDYGLGIYFSEKFKKDFEKYHPKRYGINQNNFHLVRALVEEMDHYVLVSYSAANEKPVTWLEAELQARITEYFTMKLMVSRQHKTYPKMRPEAVESLKERLFDTRLYDHLEDLEIRERYEGASKMARAFTNHLDKIKDSNSRLKILREFYRKSPRNKLGYITQKTGVMIN